MPIIKSYVVSETREVRVHANNAVDAVRIAGVAFAKGQNSDYGVKAGDEVQGVWGNTSTRIETVSINADEVR